MVTDGFEIVCSEDVARARAVAAALRAPQDAASPLTLIKESKGRVYRYSDAHGTLYLKVFSPRTLRDRVVQWLRPPRRLYAMAAALQAAGVPSPRPVAAWQYESDGRIHQAFLMTAVPGRPVKDLAADAVTPTQRLQLLGAYGRLLGRLIGSGFVPVDTVKSNFIVDLSRDPVEVAIIDVDNIRKPPWVPEPVVRRRLLKFARRHVVALARLWGEPPPSHAIRHFVRSYAHEAGIPLTDAWTQWCWVGRKLRRASPRAYDALQNVPLRAGDPADGMG
ncbi:phosphotransferase [Halorhodospira halophila]|uniref:phosphotransferase n=1 Tax=Halorhodospira halophila TaxID=1053 RepID=UPI001911F4B4|nr:phosphotransferase [Halorhodospira halophila]MBK5935374.1 hypothetical protein [Halorhodospira halophila]